MKAEHYPRAERETENNPDGFRWRIQTHCAGRQTITETVVCVMDLARMGAFEAVHGTGLPAAAVLGLIDAARTTERLVKKHDDLAAELNRIKDGNSGLLDRALNAEKLVDRVLSAATSAFRVDGSKKEILDDLCGRLQGMDLHRWERRKREIDAQEEALSALLGARAVTGDVANLSLAINLLTDVKGVDRIPCEVKEKPVVIDFEKKLTPANQEAPEAAASMLSRLGDNAQKWAQEFIAVMHQIGWSELDEALMTSWFANAIEHSNDVRRWKREGEKNPGLPETEVQIGPNGTTLKFHGIPTAGQIKELEDLGLLEKELPAS